MARSPLARSAVVAALAASAVRLVVALLRGTSSVDEHQYRAVATYLRTHGEPLVGTYTVEWPFLFSAMSLTQRVTGRVDPDRAVEVVTTLVVLATALLLARLVQRGAGALEATIAAALYPLAILAFEGASSRVELYAGLFVSAALVVRLGPEGTCSPRRMGLVGALLGLAATEKSQLGALAFAVPLLDWRDGASPGTWLRSQVAAAIGFLVPLVLHRSAVVAHTGLEHAVHFYGAYVARYPSSGAQLGKVANLAMRFAPTFWDPVFLVGLARAVTLRRGARALLLERRLALVLACAVLATVVGWRISRHYFLIAMPAAVPLAAITVARLLRAARDDRDGGDARTLLAGLVLLGASQALYLGTSGLYAAPSSDEPWRAPAAEIASRTSPEDHVFVWGWRPELYNFSGRAPATGYVMCAPVARDWGPPDPSRADKPTDPFLEADLVRALERDPPALFVDASAVSNQNPHLYALGRYPQVVRFLASRYKRAAPIGPMPVFERR